MLSYQHGYHAGNFADVMKHIGLISLLTYQTKKEKPLLYLDTHAGKGLYDLNDRQALKTAEYQQGIELLFATKESLPPIIMEYLQCIKQINTNDVLRYYPGSPALALHYLRQQDRLVFAEWHPKEFSALQQISRQKKHITFHNDNGLLQLRALLPPPERRGLIFIDPSYEIKIDYRDIPLYLKEAYQRFETGVYCLWYPLLDRKYNEQLQRGLQNIGATNHLRAEFCLNSLMPGEGMKGCGLWIINPPYLLKKELQTAFNTLRRIFNPGQSFYLLE